MLIRVLEYLCTLKRVIGYFLGYKFYIIPGYKGTDLVILIFLAQVPQDLRYSRENMSMVSEQSSRNLVCLQIKEKSKPHNSLN